MRRILLLGAVIGAPLGLAGCGQEAGAFLDGGTFGNAAMNNHLVQTCQNQTHDKWGGGKCQPRTLDGKYANVTYQTYQGSGAELPSVVTSFRGRGTGSAQ